MRTRLHDNSELPGDHYHRLGWNAALEALEDAVLNELGEVITRDELLRQIRLLVDKQT
jgi:hypothetical protein